MRIERNSFIERMKQQTIGVEVEMFGINRKRAAVLTAKSGSAGTQVEIRLRLFDQTAGEQLSAAPEVRAQYAGSDL